MRKFYIGLDLGHYEIKFSVLEEIEGGDLALYNSYVKNESFYKSEIIDQNSLTAILENIFKQISETFQLKRIDKINLSFNLPNFNSFLQKGHVIFENNVTKNDVERVIKNAKNFALLSNQEIILEEPVKFIIDGIQEARDPVGFYGRRLDAEVFLISCSQTFFNKIKEIFKNLGIEINKILPSTYISAKYFLSKKDKEIGTGIFEVGDSTTILGVFSEGRLCYFKSFDFGSRYIFEDLAIYLKVDLDEIENLKTEFFKKETELRKTKKLKKTNITKFIEKKLKEYFDDLKLKEAFKDIKKQFKLPGGLVIFGPFLCNMELENFLKSYFESQIKLPKDELKLFDTEEELVKFSASAGSAILLKELSYEEENLLTKIKNIFNTFFSR